MDENNVITDYFGSTGSTGSIETLNIFDDYFEEKNLAELIEQYVNEEDVNKKSIFLKEIKYNLKNKKDDINDINYGGSTPLFTASLYGEIDLVRLLLQQNDIEVDKQDIL